MTAINREPVHCDRHDVDFVRFDGPDGNYSWGCPTCVGIIRDQVRAMRSFHESRIRGKRKDVRV